MSSKEEVPYQAFRKTISKTINVDGLDIFISYPSQGRLFTSLTKLQETERPRSFPVTAAALTAVKGIPISKEYPQTAAQARRVFGDFMRVMALTTTDEMLQWIASLATRKSDGNLVANKNLFVCRLEGRFGYEFNHNGRTRFDSTYTLISQNRQGKRHIHIGETRRRVQLSQGGGVSVRLPGVGNARGLAGKVRA